MKNIATLFPGLLLVAAIVVLVAACSSGPVEIEEGLSPAEYFQRAQEASDESHYQLALDYYEKFLQDYPEEVDRNLWAKYEIALLYYKMGNNKTALERFEALLQEYEDSEEELTEGPKILAEKLIARIEEKLASEEAESPESPGEETPAESAEQSGDS
jgi:outer membrane protein assembly factor BamD (BamD/ComL family)